MHFRKTCAGDIPNYEVLFLVVRSGLKRGTRFPVLVQIRAPKQIKAALKKQGFVVV